MKFEILNPKKHRLPASPSTSPTGGGNTSNEKHQTQHKAWAKIDDPNLPISPSPSPPYATSFVSPNPPNPPPSSHKNCWVNPPPDSGSDTDTRSLCRRNKLVSES